MPDSNKTARAAQARLLPGATNWGENWTSADLNMLVECADIPAAELAECLGRTLYAVQTARQGLLLRQAVQTDRPAPRPPKPCERTYTFIDGDVPEGW